MNKTILAKPKRKSKKQMILEHLLSGKTLTQWECTHLYRHLRLGAVIYDLREAGYDITTIICKNANDNGTHAMYLYKGGAK